MEVETLEGCFRVTSVTADPQTLCTLLLPPLLHSSLSPSSLLLLLFILSLYLSYLTNVMAPEKAVVAVQ